ncbi:hypothetical protein BTJ49_15215, partial [Oleiagrimonas sp. MCCC 1A03011]
MVVNLSRGISDDNISLIFVYDEQSFDKELISRFGDYYLTACKQLLANLEQRHNHESLLSDAERTLLLETWNQTEAPYPHDLCIHQL